MAKSYLINYEDREVVLNITQLDAIYESAVHFDGGQTFIELSDADIEGIKEMVEQYTGGISPEIVEELERQIAELNTQIAGLNAEIEEDQRQIATLNEQVESDRIQIEALNNDIQAKQAQIEALTAQVAQLEQEVQDAYQRGYDEGYEAGSKGPFKGLCFTAEQAGSTIKQNTGKTGCSYWTSADGNNWEPYTLGTVITLTNIGDKVYWKGNGISNSGSTATFVMTGKIAASGSAMSMIDEVGESLDMTGNSFRYMFFNCKALTQAPELPAKMMSFDGYSNMFYNCSNLTKVPSILPATTLANQCYQYMFRGCTSLTTAPELPAMKLTPECYSGMFYGCTALTIAQTLPATTLVQSCYYQMFYNCSNLTTVPELPAMTVNYNSYRRMFYGCSKLNYIKVGATSWNTDYALDWVSGVSPTGTFVKPKDTEIPTGTSGIPTGWTAEIAGTYKEGYDDGYEDGYEDGSKGSYNGLCFTAEEAGSTVWIDSEWCATNPEYSTDVINWLPFTDTVTLPNVGDKIYVRAENCYNEWDDPIFIMSGKIAASGSMMSLIGDETSTDLTGHDYAFSNAFRDCTALTKAPELTATTLMSNCYNSMFFGCSNLETAPELPANPLADNCYSSMFGNCSKLNYIKVGATSWGNALYWVYGVSPTGTFVKPKDTEIPTGTSGIPAGWTVEIDGTYKEGYEDGYTDGYEAGSHPFKGLCFTAEEAGSTVAQNIGKSGCSYWTSTNGNNWEPYTLGTVITLTNVGDKIYWKGNGISNDIYSMTSMFVLTGLIAASGSVMSLIDEVGESLDMTGNDFRYMFFDCPYLTKAPELPATTLTERCYHLTFYNCTSLTTAPKLPAKTLTYYCYESMFAECTSLTTASELPATTLTEGCYNGMFYGCTALTTVPELPATTLTEGCYESMFAGCASLTTAPELPATTLVNGCYLNMFNRCSKLNYIKVGATSWNRDYATNWVYNVYPIGTFVKPTATNIPTEYGGIPHNWTVEEYKTEYQEGYDDGYADGSAIQTILVDEDASNVWSGTLDEYQALTPDENTIYLIHE